MKAFFIFMLCLILTGCSGDSPKEQFKNAIYDNNIHHIDHEYPMECLINGKHFINIPDGPAMCEYGSLVMYYVPDKYGVFIVEDGLVSTAQSFDMDYVWGLYAIRWLTRAIDSGDYGLYEFNGGWRVQYVCPQPNKDDIWRFEIMLDSEYRPVSANFELVDGTVYNLAILRFGDFDITIPDVIKES